MDVVSTCPLRVASLAWQARAGTWVLTVVCKATYRLEQGVSPLAEAQEHPNDDDNHWDDDPARSVYAPGDLAPFKTRAEVLLVGNAFAPGGKAVPSLNVRLRVGEVEKTIAVHGDRFWTPDGRLRGPIAFARMSLRYERAAGGPDTENPVGMRPDAANALGEVPVPNLWPPDRAPQHRGEIVPPIGLGPIAATWPGRRAKLGPPARGFAVRDLSRAPLPPEVDPVFFTSAPRDQQLAEIRSDESLLLENLHPRFPRLATRLPGITPRAYVERRGAAPQEVALRGDTLWIDTDRSIATLTFRGQVPLRAAGEPGRVVVGVAPPSQGEAEEAESLSDDDIREGDEASLILPAPDGDGVSTVLLSGAPDAAQTMPFALASDLGAPDPSWRAEPAGAAQKSQDLPAGWAAPPSLPVAAGTDLGRDAARDVRQSLPRGVLELSDAAASAARAVRPGEDAAAPKVEAAAPKVEAAAPKAEERTARARRPAEILKLLWFDPEVVPRLNRHAEWRILLAEMELRLLDGPEDEAPETDDTKARRAVFEVLSRGAPSPPDALRNALNYAVDERGAFEPPLVLLSGEIELPFDEVEALKAAVTVLTPLGPTDRKLRDALDAAGDFLKTPGADRFGRLAEALADRLRDAFGQARRTLPADYVESHVERALLRQRAYSMKTLYGRRWIRALLRGAGAAAPPVYLPEALRDGLPAYKRVQIKALGEVDLQEDQEEAAGWAVKIGALARVISGL